MTNAEIYEVIEGFKNRKKLEIKGHDEWLPSPSTNIISLMGSITDGVRFRVKPYPKYRPFETVEELKQIRDKWIKHKETEGIFRITSIHHLKIGIDNGGSFLDCKGAFDCIVFEDGTPFGVEVKEEKEIVCEQCGSNEDVHLITTDDNYICGTCLCKIKSESAK